MIQRTLFIALLFIAAMFAASVTSAQTDASNNPMGINGRRTERPDAPPTFSEMLAKKRAEQEKREHEELLKRGDTALALADELETSFEKNEKLSNEDAKKLAELEKLVVKIRRELGGDDGDGEIEDTEPPKPSTMKEAIGFLKNSTVKLVDELKRTTRFSISAVAIQTSNAVIRVARLLRFRKSTSTLK